MEGKVAILAPLLGVLLGHQPTLLCFEKAIRRDVTQLRVLRLGDTVSAPASHPETFLADFFTRFGSIGMTSPVSCGHVL
jgi:hypothetical protein